MICVHASASGVLLFYTQKIYKNNNNNSLKMSGTSSSQRPRLNPLGGDESSNSDDSGIFNERILLLVFQSIKWDIHVICQMASVCRRLRAVAKRLLWKELCAYRAPRLISTLTDGVPSSSRMGGGWHALAKVLFFCCGCHSSRHFRVRKSVADHFTKESRFSKTSGRSFLIKKCRNDVLFVSDPCEHPTGDKGHDLGIYRGVFRGFLKSRTRACLLSRRVELEEGVRCPYCGARVWSMTAARLIPKSAERRLGSSDDGIEYFVCINGHLHGTCWLVPLSSDEDDHDDSDDDAGDDDCDDGTNGERVSQQPRMNGSLACVGDWPTM